MAIAHPHIDVIDLEKNKIERHDMPSPCVSWSIQVRGKGTVKIAFDRRRHFEAGKYWTLTDKDPPLTSPPGSTLHSLRVFYLSENRDAQIECMAYEVK